MSLARSSFVFLENEAAGLIARLQRVNPFALQMTSVPAAAVSPAAQSGIEQLVAEGVTELRLRIEKFLEWLRSSAAKLAAPLEANRRFTMLRLRFNVLLSHVDIFADALVQR